jgi:hypothetical protein
MKLPKFKIRASAASKILTGTIGLTESQERDYDALSKRRSDAYDGVEGVKPLTPTMLTKLEGLEHLKNNPVLPKTVTSYCDEWIKEQLYKRKKEFSSKYTEKGNIMEDWGIDFCADHLDLGILLKNEESFENCCMTGTPDVIIPDDMVIDIKNPWDCFTFPLFEEEPPIEYYAQAQVYMNLTGLRRFKLVYTLSNTPDNIIVGETIKFLRSGGYGHIEDNEDILKEFADRMMYDDVDDKLRIKVFTIDYDPSMVAEIKSRVKICREYIDEKIKRLKL